MNGTMDMERNASNISYDVYDYDGSSNRVYYTGEETHSFFYLYIMPFILTFGILGNLLSLIALRRPPLNNFSSSIYLSAYAVSSLFFLILNPGLEWIYDMSDYQHFSKLIGGGCRIWQFVIRMISYSGIWFIIAGAVDRCIALWIPYKAQIMCTVFMAKASVVFTIIGLTVVSIHAIWMFDVSEEGLCLLQAIDRVSTQVWNWLSMMTYTLIPQILLFFLGNLIVIRLCLKHRGRNIPEAAGIEMDQTYAITVLAMIYFYCSTPATIINLVFYFDPAMRKYDQIYSLTNFIILACYCCLVIILTACCSAFRESVATLFKSCILLLKTGSATVELRLLNDEYQHVPSTSTTL